MKETKKQSYLEKIQFDPNLWNSWVGKYVVNVRFVALLVVAIFAVGLYGYFNLPRRLNPEIKIPIVTVMTVLPGAGPADIESLVTKPIEDSLRSIKGIDTMTSTSRDNASIVTLQFVSSIQPEKAKSDVQSEIDSLTSLPKDAKTPVVKAFDFEDRPVWTFAVSTTKDIRSLMSFSKELQNRIEDSPKVERVTVSGFETQEIAIYISPEKVKEYGINPLTLSTSIQKGVLSYPAGMIDTSRNAFALTIDPQVTNVAEIRQIRITVAGKQIKLGDIATIAERSKKDQKATFVASPTTTSARAVTFYVYKTTTSNIDEAGKAVNKIVTDAAHEYNDNFAITTISDTSYQIEKQFNDLLKEFRSTIILIVGCLFIFLGLRQAIISSFSVPLTFLMAFFFMNMLGQSINFLTLFAFLIALGLLIDDTIVVVSAMTSYYKTGKFTPAETGLVVWRDTIVPIWSTTITTIWAFVPLLLTTGIIGEFIKPIPLVITVTMLSSTAIAVLITLPFMIIILKPQVAARVVTLAKIVAFVTSLYVLKLIIPASPVFPFVVISYIAFVLLFMHVRKTLVEKIQSIVKNNGVLATITHYTAQFSNHGVINIESMARAYQRLIMRILNSASARKKVIIAIVSYAIISFALLPLGLVKNEFFPKTDNTLIYVNLSLPPGTSLPRVTAEAQKIMDILRKTKDILFVAGEVGQEVNSSASRSDSGSGVVFTVHLPEKENRHHSSSEIATMIRAELKEYRAGTVSVVEIGGGPPAGSDLQIKLSGDDLGKLDTYANSIISYLKAKPGVTSIDKSIKPGTSKLVFVPDLAKLADNGITVDAIGLWIRMYSSGFTLEQVNFDKKESVKEDVVFYLTDSDSTPQELSALQITGSTGVSVPLSALGRFEMKSNPTVITRENRIRTLSVTAGVLPGFSVTSINADLEKYANSLKLDKGYSWQTGGVNDENKKSIISIVQAMSVAFILILITMVVQFQSYRQAIIVLLVIPLAVSSVFMVFALTGTPISFPAMIGILALFGIVVTNSMFIVDKININLKEGMEFKEAIADAGASRLEPIILTKLNTILGLLPITLSNPMWRGLGGAIISGILLASTIMLLFIPAVYYNWFKEDTEQQLIT
jgi:HAE1 family hydrophobic/amphiphilic exporter-1